MKAIQLIETGEPVVERQVDVPTVAPGEILIRVGAAGICHSDAHYRSGESPTGELPISPGHEVAGIVEQVGNDVESVSVGNRVALDYLVTCGDCPDCLSGQRQFCPTGQMLGKHCDGGWAERIVVPAGNAVLVPESVSLESAAVMMCSSSTSLHALCKARMKPGETVAVFGAGGLGMSAIQLAQVLEASQVFAVDINAERLAIAREFGAVAIDASVCDPVDAIRDQTGGRGVDVALELIGLGATMQQAVRSLAPLGRAALAGLTKQDITLNPYTDLINREAEVIGVSDHMASDLPQLLAWAAEGKLDTARVITQRVALEAAAINGVLDRLDQHGSGIRAVIVPEDI